MATLKNRAKRAAEDTIEDADIETRFEQARAEFYRIAAGLADAGSAKAKDFTETVSAKASEIKSDVNDVTGDAIDTFLDQLTALEKDVATRVRERPLQALAIAGGIGFLFALLSRR